MRFVIPVDQFDGSMEKVDDLIKAFAFDDALDLIKAATHKYMRRIHNAKPPPKYRYVYKETSKHHKKEFKVGEKLQVTQGNEKGHYEIVDLPKSGYVTVKHDESGQHVSMTVAHLHELFQKEHDTKLTTAHTRLKRTHEAAKKHGSEKQRMNAWKTLTQFERRWGMGKFEEKKPKLVIKEEPKPVVADRVLELSKFSRQKLEKRVASLRAHQKQLVQDGKAVAISEIRELRQTQDALDLRTSISLETKDFTKEKKTETTKTRFPNKEAAYKELVGANSGMDFGEWESRDAEYRRKGRKGMTPAVNMPGFDYFNQTLDLEKPTKFEKRPDNRIVSMQDWFDRYMAEFHPGETQWWALDDVCHHLGKVFPGFNIPTKVNDSIMSRTLDQEAANILDSIEREKQIAEDDARVEREAIQAAEKGEPEEIDDSFDFGANLEPEPTTTDIGEEMAQAKIAADMDIPGETDQPEPKRKKAKSQKKRPPLDKIEATGDHIWGSRKDLERIQNITSSEQLLHMNYDDAVQLVRKKNLVPAHDMQTLKGLGMTPGTAHMSLALVAAIVAKPGDSKESRSRYVDEVHAVLGSMASVKTLDDFRMLLREMGRRQQSSPKWESVYKGSMGMGREAVGAKIAELQKENPNKEYRYRTSYFSGTTEIVVRATRPYDVLGKSFVSFIAQKGKKHSSAYREAMSADNAWGHSKATVEDGWKYLEERGTKKAEERKAKAEKAKGSKVKRWSGAKIIATTVAREGATVEVPNADPDRVKNTFDLREVDYGTDGYMSQADREEHTKALEGALHDFSEVLGIDPKMVSLNGRLGVAMGARGRGKASAHYEPGRFVINITKFRGGGTLAHEWGHALDNLIATVNTAGDTTGERLHLSNAPESKQWPEKVQKAYMRVHKAMHEHPDPERAKKEHFEKIASVRKEEQDLIGKNNDLVREVKKLQAKKKPETAKAQIKISKERNIATWEKEAAELEAKEKKKGKLSRKDDIDLAARRYWIKDEKKLIAGLKSGELVRTEADDKRIEQIKDGIEDIRLPINRLRDQINSLKRVDPTASRYAKDSAILGKGYWGTPHEMFARAFEAYVQDELHGKERKSTYLVDGTTEKYLTGKPSPHGDDAQPYPQGEERDNIREAMISFVRSLKEEKQFEKALQFLDDFNDRDPVFVIPLERVA